MDLEDYVPLVKGAIHTLLALCGTVRIIKSRSKSLLLIPKSISYYLKLVIVVVIAAISTVLCVLATERQRKWQYGLDAAIFVFSGVVHHIEYSYSVISSTILLFYWLFMFAAQCAQIGFDYVGSGSMITPMTYASMVINLGIMVIFILECIPKPKSLYQTLEDDENLTPEATSNIFSRLSFHWMTSLMKLGRSKVLSMDDLWTLDEADTTDYNSRKFEKYFNKELQKKRFDILNQSLLVTSTGWGLWEAIGYSCDFQVLSRLASIHSTSTSELHDDFCQ